MKMAKSKKRVRKTFLFIRAFIRLIDKKLITPITKFILMISDKLGKRTDKFERWLVRKNTLMFLSLLLALVAYVAIDNKTVILVDSYAEVLYDQKVDAIYNTETYVVEGLPETVDVTLIGRKVDMYLAKQLSTGTISVDISNLEEGTHKVALNYESGIDSVDYKLDPSTVNVTIHQKVSALKTATIDTINKESLDTKLSVTNVSIDKTEIIIKGSKKTIEQVANIRALVDINKLIEPEVGILTLKDVPIIAYDENGKVIDVEMVPSKVTATINVASPKKEVPIKIIPKGEVQFGKAISVISSNSTKITLYGSEDVLSDIEYLPVEIDVTKLGTNKEFNIALTAPEGIRELSLKTIKVNISLGEEISKEIENVMIETINLDPNYKVAAVGMASNKTTVIVKGTKEVLDSIDESKIKALVDLSGYTETKGDYDTVSVYVTGDDVKATYTPKTKEIRVKISKK